MDLCDLFFQLAKSPYVIFYITSEKLIGGQISNSLRLADVLQNDSLFIPSKFLGPKKKKWSPTRWNGFDFLCLLLSLVDVVLVFLVLIVSQWNFSLGSASIIKAKSGKRKDFETCAGSELEKTNLESSSFRVVNLDNFFTSFSQIEHPKKCPTGWWFSGYFLFSSRNLGEIFIPFDLRICFRWVFSRNLATN